MKTYIKPEVDAYAFSMEGTLLAGSPKPSKPGWGNDKGDNGESDGHTAPPGQKNAPVFSGVEDFNEGY